MGGEGRWEGKAGRKFSRYTVYIEQATTFDEARRPTSARILAIFAVHRPVPRQRVARFTFRTYLATKPSHRFLRFNVSIPLFCSQKTRRDSIIIFLFFYRGYSVHRQDFSIRLIYLKSPTFIFSWITPS